MPAAVFRIKVDYFGLLATRIRAGKYVDGEQLAAAVQQEVSLPFPPVFRDYLCRFLAGKVKRRRGRPKVSNLGDRHGGGTGRNRMEYITKRIQSGDYVGGTELADVLRHECAGEIPDLALNYFCQFLKGNVEKPRGRTPLPSIYKRQRDMVISGFYRRYADRLIKRQAREGRPAGWTRLHETYRQITPAEIAARIVARCWLSGVDSWRSVQTISSNYSRYRKRR